MFWMRDSFIVRDLNHGLSLWFGSVLLEIASLNVSKLDESVTQIFLGSLRKKTPQFFRCEDIFVEEILCSRGNSVLGASCFISTPPSDH